MGDEVLGDNGSGCEGLKMLVPTIYLPRAPSYKHPVVGLLTGGASQSRLTGAFVLLLALLVS